MEDLLPYYERELAFLRSHSREFAERYPKIAARLLLSGEACDDPHVERMIESFALLSARISRKLEDSYPKFTEALLNVLYPHYLRPFPACSIAHFDVGGGEARVSGAATIPRGTELHSRPVGGVACRFRTAWNIDLQAVRIVAFAFEPTARIPSGMRAPPGASGTLTLKLVLPERNGTPAARNRTRLYIDAETSVAATLRDALFLRCAAVWVEGVDGWHLMDEALVAAVGFEADQALIDFPANSHDAYRHLTEYFAFPEKYNFFDLLLDRLPARAGKGGEISIHFILKDLATKVDVTQLLTTLNAGCLKSGCVPVINLFRRRGEPIRLTGRTSRYPVVADARQAHAFEVYSIDSVQRIRKTNDGESCTEFRPFFSLQHGETQAADSHYWLSERVAEGSPGYELALTIVGPDSDPFECRSDVLSIDLTCTNRDLPQMLAIGMEGGDLFMEGGAPARAIRLLRKPTSSCRFDHRGDGQWRLVSHLSLNHLSLTGSGTAAFREMLGLYDVRRTAISRRQVACVKHIERHEKTWWATGRPFACFMRGVEVRLTVDEDGLVGAGVDLFARVVDRFLGLYVHLNSFAQLVLISSRTGEELLRCEPRSGDSILL